MAARHSSLAPILALGLLLLAAVCLGRRLPMTGIAGSKDAEAGEFPSMAAIEMFMEAKKEWVVYCSGTVLDDRHILTAAHCAGVNSKFRVTLGCQQLSKCKRAVHEYDIERAMIHRELNNFTYDIAILRLSNKITFVRGSIEPVEIASYNVNESNKSEQMSVAGWGRSWYAGSWFEGADRKRHLSDKLRKIDVKLLPFAECKKPFEPFEISVPSICVAGKNRDVSKIDLAGPLFQRSGEKKVQVGLFYYANENPYVFQDVTRFHSWVQACIRDEVGCQLWKS